MTEAAAEPVVAPSVLELALAFNRLAFESVGGGLAAWSQRMIVDEKRWLSQEEFLSASTICGILPGANQVNLAVFVGTRYRGLAGGLAAVFGLVTLPALAALVLAALYVRFHDAMLLRHFMMGMSCAAAGLAMSVALKQARTVFTSWVPLALGLATFAASAVIRAPLWLTLSLLAPLGFAWAWRRVSAPVEP